MKKDNNTHPIFKKKISLGPNYKKIEQHLNLTFNMLPEMRLSPDGKLAVVRKKLDTKSYSLEVVNLLTPNITMQQVETFSQNDEMLPTRPYITQKYLAISVDKNDSDDRATIFIYPAVPVRGSAREFFSSDSGTTRIPAQPYNSEVIAIDDEANRMVVVANGNTLYLYVMDLPRIEYKDRYILPKGRLSGYGSVFVNGVLTLTSGATQTPTSGVGVLQFKLSDDSFDDIVSFSISHAEQPFSIINVDEDNDEFWAATRNSLVKISMKEKKIIKRIIANGAPIFFYLKMAGKFLVALNYHFIIAIDTESVAEESSFDETVVKLLLTKEVDTSDFSSDMVSDGEAIMVVVTSKDEFPVFHVITAEEMENQYPSTNLSTLKGVLQDWIVPG